MVSTIVITLDGESVQSIKHLSEGTAVPWLPAPEVTGQGSAASAGQTSAADAPLSLITEEDIKRAIASDQRYQWRTLAAIQGSLPQFNADAVERKVTVMHTDGTLVRVYNDSLGTDVYRVLERDSVLTDARIRQALASDPRYTWRTSKAIGEYLAGEFDAEFDEEEVAAYLANMAESGDLRTCHSTRLDAMLYRLA
jgi:hypothetical protein